MGAPGDRRVGGDHRSVFRRLVVLAGAPDRTGAAPPPGAARDARRTALPVRRLGLDGARRPHLVRAGGSGAERILPRSPALSRLPRQRPPAQRDQFRRAPVRPRLARALPAPGRDRAGDRGAAGSSRRLGDADRRWIGGVGYGFPAALRRRLRRPVRLASALPAPLFGRPAAPRICPVPALPALAPAPAGP